MPRSLPLRISIRDCFVLVLLVIFNTIHITDMGKLICLCNLLKSSVSTVYYSFNQIILSQLTIIWTYRAKKVK